MHDFHKYSVLTKSNIHYSKEKYHHRYAIVKTPDLFSSFSYERMKIEQVRELALVGFTLILRSIKELVKEICTPFVYRKRHEKKEVLYFEEEDKLKRQYFFLYCNESIHEN